MCRFWGTPEDHCSKAPQGPTSSNRGALPGLGSVQGRVAGAMRGAEKLFLGTEGLLGPGRQVGEAVRTRDPKCTGDCRGVCVLSSGRGALPGLLAALSCRGDIGRPRPGTGCLSHCPPEAGGSPGRRAAQATGSRSGALLEAVVREQAELGSARLFSPFSAASVRADCALRSDGESQGRPSLSHVPVRRTPARPTERTQRVTPSSWAGPPPPGLL